jgi:hypothetical protein
VHPPWGSRETWSIIQQGGWSACDITHFAAMQNPLLTVLSPHIMGKARK